ncbi:unnamed protein product [Caenorhabditis brenneri]
MSQVSLDNSDTTDTGTIVYATRVPEGVIHSVERATALIHKKPEQERILILCQDNVARSIMRSFIGKGIKTCLFVLDVCEEPSIIAEEKNKFDSFTVAVCSFEAYFKVDLSHVENYAIIGFPAKVKHLPKMLDKIESAAEAEGHMTRVDFIISADENPKFLILLHMELFNRKGQEACPTWLTNAVILTHGPPERQARLIEENRRGREQAVAINQNQEQANTVAASDTSGSPMTSFSHGSEPSQNSVNEPNKKLKINRPDKDFDIYSMKPNAEGQYIVPMRMIDFQEQEDIEDEYESDDDVSNEEEYNYDDEYDPEYDMDYL